MRVYLVLSLGSNKTEECDSSFFCHSQSDDTFAPIAGLFEIRTKSEYRSVCCSGIIRRPADEGEGFANLFRTHWTNVAMKDPHHANPSSARSTFNTFSALAVTLFLASVAQDALGFDQYMSCGHGNDREPKQFRFPQQVPCDFNTDNWCNVPGETYPWQAVRRFVYENHGLMRRMYGDVRQGSVLREEFLNHHPDDDDDGEGNEDDVPVNDVRHRYAQNTNELPSTGAMRNVGRGFGRHDDGVGGGDGDGNGEEKRTRGRRPDRDQRQHEATAEAWNEPFFGDVVAGVANNLDGGTRQRQPEQQHQQQPPPHSARRGRELSLQQYTANHVAAFDEDKPKILTDDDIHVVGGEIRFQGLVPTAQLQAIANIQYVHAHHRAPPPHQQHRNSAPGGAKFSFGHQSHHSDAGGGGGDNKFHQDYKTSGGSDFGDGIDFAPERVRDQEPATTTTGPSPATTTITVTTSTAAVAATTSSPVATTPSTDASSMSPYSSASSSSSSSPPPPSAGVTSSAAPSSATPAESLLFVATDGDDGRGNGTAGSSSNKSAATLNGTVVGDREYRPQASVVPPPQPSSSSSSPSGNAWEDDSSTTENFATGTERVGIVKKEPTSTMTAATVTATTEPGVGVGGVTVGAGPTNAAVPNAEASSSLLLEERRKPAADVVSGSSFLSSTDAADEDGLGPTADAVNDDDYYQPTSGAITEQPAPPKTSQRPNNKYPKMKGVNACPVKEEVVAPYWANNTRGEVLALLNLYPFEQYIHWEKCTYEHKQMYCRDGCRCEQQYRLHRLLAFDPKNECRGIFSDWFKFPSCCVCKCYDLPFLRPAGGEESEEGEEMESAATGEAPSPSGMMTPAGQDDERPAANKENPNEDDTDLYSAGNRTPRLRNYLDAEIDFGPANIEPLDQADYLAYQLSRDHEEQLRLQLLQQQLEAAAYKAQVPGSGGAYSPSEDDRVVMEADQIVGPAYAYYDPGYAEVKPREEENNPVEQKRSQYGYDPMYGVSNSSAPLPLIRQPRGARN